MGVNIDKKIHAYREKYMHIVPAQKVGKTPDHYATGLRFWQIRCKCMLIGQKKKHEKRAFTCFLQKGGM